jgi:hypothetical protein
MNSIDLTTIGVNLIIGSDPKKAVNIKKYLPRKNKVNMINN